jgi:hypothetical protein
VLYKLSENVKFVLYDTIVFFSDDKFFGPLCITKLGNERISPSFTSISITVF